MTWLPDHVIADRRGQNAAEDRSMHVRQRTETKKGQKKVGEKRSQFRRKAKPS